MYTHIYIYTFDSCYPKLYICHSCTSPNCLARLQQLSDGVQNGSAGLQAWMVDIPKCSMYLGRLQLPEGIFPITMVYRRYIYTIPTVRMVYKPTIVYV